MLLVKLIFPSAAGASVSIVTLLPKVTGPEKVTGPAVPIESVLISPFSVIAEAATITPPFWVITAGRIAVLALVTVKL